MQISTQNTSVIHEPLDWKKVEVLKVNRHDVKVFEYKDEQAAADAVAKRTMLDSASEHGANMTTNRSHIYRTANIVAKYLGDDLGIINLLESVLGKEISASTMPSNKGAEAEVTRLGKEMEEGERKE